MRKDMGGKKSTELQRIEKIFEILYIQKSLVFIGVNNNDSYIKAIWPTAL